MTLSHLISMSVFALAASISPGPVNLVCLSTGIRHSWKHGLNFVTGATLGFIALFLCIGLGLYGLILTLPILNEVLRYTGVLFLLYMSYRLFTDDGKIQTQSDKAPTFLLGVLMQWLNPKAWLASASGIAAYTSGNNLNEVYIFSFIYLPVCWLSLSCWVGAGTFLQKQVEQSSILRFINRALALAIASSSILLLFHF